METRRVGVGERKRSPVEQHGGTVISWLPGDKKSICLSCLLRVYTRCRNSHLNNILTFVNVVFDIKRRDREVGLIEANEGVDEGGTESWVDVFYVELARSRSVDRP